MKVAIIILGNTWVCPYVNTYKRIFESIRCAYDVILWDRDGSDATVPVRYSSGGANLANPLVKAYHYLKYADFIKKTIQKNGYDRLVVSGPHLAILLSAVLRKKYKGRYIIDYRDISVEQHLLLGGVYSKVLESSFCNVISSPAFKEYLPREYDYLISHNFDVNRAIRSMECEKRTMTVVPPLNVLTIGYIRNYYSNVKIIQSLGDNDNYRLNFVGRGDAAVALEEYATSNGISNICFSGFYKKEDEPSIVEECHFINIFFPDDVVHSAIMSNRFYLALIHKRPMIVNAGSVQATYVEKYALGVVYDGCGNLDAEIKSFLTNFDYATFCKNCNELLAIFVQEHRALECAVAALVQL